MQSFGRSEEKTEVQRKATSEKGDPSTSGFLSNRRGPQVDPMPTQK